MNKILFFKVEEKSTISPLVAGLRKEVQALVTEVSTTQRYSVMKNSFENVLALKDHKGHNQFQYIVTHTLYHLLTDSEVITGKSQTMALM